MDQKWPEVLQRRHRKRRRRLWKEQLRKRPSGEGKNLFLVATIFLLLSFLLSLPNLTNAMQIQRTNPSQPYHHYNQQLQQKKQPYFSDQEPAGSVQRIVVGRPVKFKCVVSDIGEHKLAWFHKDKRLLLAFDNSTVAWKERIQVSSLANSVFFLSIDSVQLSDKGHYSCQLNTQPAKSQSHILDVVKSPSIREEATTHSIEPVKEFSSAELRCAADGIPKPTIKWRRESQMHLLPPITHEEEDEEDEANKIPAESESDSDRKRKLAAENKTTMGNFEVLAEGELLRFERVSRHDMGFYICIASNDVPPSVSQRIFLPVSFAQTQTQSSSSTSKPARKSPASSARASTLPLRSGKNLTTTTTTGSNATSQPVSARKSTTGRKQGAYFAAAERNLAARQQQRELQGAGTQQAAASSTGNSNKQGPFFMAIYSNIFLISYFYIIMKG